MKVLNGREIADFIKARQLRQVRALRQADLVIPRLAIVKVNDIPVIDAYVRLKKQYSEDILVETDVHTVKQDELSSCIDNLNKDDSVHGIIVQLPLKDESQTDEIISHISPEKDVDGMLDSSSFDPATAMAINWLLASYNIDLNGKKIAIVGHGRLVGAPLYNMWKSSGLDVTVFDKDDGKDIADLQNYDVVVTATGVPGLIKSDYLKSGAVVVDAGTASQGKTIVGDVAGEVRENRDDLTITPTRGGVGPLTVSALFDNVITSTRNTVSKSK